jgi:hypothetical protein
MSKTSNKVIMLMEAAEHALPLDREYLESRFFTAMKHKYGQVDLCGYEIDAITALHYCDADYYDVKFESWITAQEDIITINGEHYDKDTLEEITQQIQK